MRILIAGCGDVGNVLADTLLRDGHCVYGLKRDTSTLPAAVMAISADLTEPSSLRDLPADIDRLVFMPTPAERSVAAYQSIYLDGWSNLRAALAEPPQQSLVVSSTSVYGQSDGSWVDESSVCEPVRFNGRILLEMEALASQTSELTTIARLSGIYGPGREGLVKLATSGRTVQGSPPLYTNRIHRDDAAAALAHLLLMEKPDDKYLVTDDLPVAKYEVISWLAKQLGCPPPPLGVDDSAGCGKQISNRRLRDSGVKLGFPNYQAGYARILKQRNDH